MDGGHPAWNCVIISSGGSPNAAYQQSSGGSATPGFTTVATVSITPSNAGAKILVAGMGSIVSGSGFWDCIIQKNGGRVAGAIFGQFGQPQQPVLGLSGHAGIDRCHHLYPAMRGGARGTILNDGTAIAAFEIK